MSYQAIASRLNSEGHTTRRGKSWRSMQVRRVLERVRERGYALDMEEYEPGVRCLAAPVRNREGKVVAAISMSAPASRLGEERMAEVSEKLLETAWEASARLGWR